MRWFKHMTDMRNDLFVKELRLKHGDEGYLIWSLTLEIYADVCGADPGDWISVDFDVFCKEIGKKPKKIEKILQFFQEKTKIFFKKNGKNLEIQIPKMLELRDEWSRKLRSCSGVTPETEERRKNTEGRIQKEEERKPLKNIDLPSKVSSAAAEAEFQRFWDEYPRKESKKDAQKAFVKARKVVSLETMLEALVVYKQYKPAYQDFKHPSTWLNGACWQDEYPGVIRGQPEERYTPPDNLPPEIALTREDQIYIAQKGWHRFVKERMPPEQRESLTLKAS